MDEIKIIVISSLTASVTTILVEFIKSRIDRGQKRRLEIEANTRNHDLGVFKVLNEYLHEGMLRGTMFSVKVNAEYYFEYFNGVDPYLIYSDDIEDGKYIDTEIEKAHRKFVKSLKDFQKDLFDDFSYDSHKTYRPNKENGVTKELIKKKYAPLTDKVLADFLTYRKLIKKKYQV